jgi:hypothetical protein
MNRLKLLSSVAALALLAVAPSALAVTTTIPAALGHPFTKSQASNFDTFDNYVITDGGIWAIPLVMSNFSSGDITVIQYPQECGQYISSAVYTFDKFGNVSDWTSFVNCGTNGSTIGTATVPQNGSAFVRSEMFVDPDASCDAKLAQVRVTW